MAGGAAVLAGEIPSTRRRSADWRQAIAAKGRMCSTIHNGCVQSWKRLISVMPCVTSGMMTTALIEIADRARDAEAHLQRRRQDHRLDREEDEGEGGVDQRGDGRADVAEAGAARQQVDVDAVFGGVIGDRQAAEEDDDADDEDRRGGVGEAVVERDGAADRLQRQERDRAERGVGDAGGGPAPRALGGEAQRVVFQRLVGNPLIVLAPDAVDPLPPCHFGHS